MWSLFVSDVHDRISDHAGPEIIHSDEARDAMNTIAKFFRSARRTAASQLASSLSQQSEVLQLPTEQVTSVETTEDALAPFQSIEKEPLRPNEAIRVIFVAQHPSIWSSWRSVWRAMDQNPRFAPKVILAPFIHPYSSAAVTLDDMRRCLNAEGIPYCPADYCDLRELRPHVSFLQNPYSETRPPHLRSEQLNQIGSRVAYIPYGLEIGGGAWNVRAQFDLPLHRLAWRIFARSNRHRKMYAKYCRAGNSHVVVTGHPKFDGANINVHATLEEELIKKIGARKVILWTPHFSVSDVPAWSTYRRYSDVIFSEFAKRQDLFLLLRPHPLFFKSMAQHDVWDANGEADFRQMINASSNIGLDEGADYHAAFVASDALMADVGSFLLEYLPTGKPLLYLHHPDGLGMNDDGELAESLYQASSDDDIKNFLQMVANGFDPRKPARDEVIPEYLAGLDQDIGKTITDHVYRSIATGDSWSPSYNAPNEDRQAVSESYWTKSTNTYLAPPEYYTTKATILQDVLQRMPAFEDAIDIGCGDGKFTLQIAAHAKQVLAFDISKSLIEKATETAASQGVTNVTFTAQEIDDISPLNKFDLVSCMGVTSCIIDDFKLLYFLDRLSALAKPGAHVFLIDTLSTAGEQMAADDRGYIAKYRPIDDYRLLLSRAGFALQEEVLIKEMADRNMINKLFVYHAV